MNHIKPVVPFGIIEVRLISLKLFRRLLCFRCDRNESSANV